AHAPPMLGKRKTKHKMSNSNPPKKVLEQLGGTGLARSSDLQQPKFGGNDPVGFTQTTTRKATGGGPGTKPKQAPGQFKAMSASGNRDFGLVGASAPAPMKPDRVPRLMGETRKKKRKGF